MDERYIDQLPLACPQPDTWPTTQACAPTGNRTCVPLVRRRLALNPLNHTSQGMIIYTFLTLLYCYCLISVISNTRIKPATWRKGFTDAIPINSFPWTTRATPRFSEQMPPGAPTYRKRGNNEVLSVSLWSSSTPSVLSKVSYLNKVPKTPELEDPVFLLSILPSFKN